MGRLEAVNWRVDYTLSSSEIKQVNEPTVQLRLQAQDPETDSTETTVVSITADKFRVLLTGGRVIFFLGSVIRYCIMHIVNFPCFCFPELKQAQTMMNALQ